VDELVRVTSNREEIRNQLLNIFLPTRDAAAVGLSGALFHLARHPDVFNKLRAEVLSIKGPVTYDVLESLTYVRAVLNESVLL
jgi:cytochrome P450